MRPGPLLLPLLILWAVFGLGAAFWPHLIYVWYITFFGILFFVIADVLMLSKVIFEAERKVPNPLPVGVWSKVKLKLLYASSKPIKAMVYDHYPSEVEAKGLPRELAFRTSGQLEFEYRIRPSERGSVHFGSSQIIVEGSFRLMTRSLNVGEGVSTKVYPNFQNVAGYALLAAENRVSQMGILKKRRRGEGLDFHQLRHYRVGDSMRQIDWKATSRLKKIISREYQEERDQQVVFLLDCGRRMMAKDGDLSHFDHTLNSLLLMTYVALRQGDSVGLMTFSGEKRWMSPRKGEHRLNEMMNLIYDLQPSSQGSDYSSAATALMSSLKKRALVVVLSNLRDEDSDDVVPAIHLLKKNHLVLFASLQEADVNRVLNKKIRSFEDSITVAATHRYLAGRRQAHEHLSHRNVVTVDVEPADLPVALVNRYLEIKSSQLL